MEKLIDVFKVDLKKLGNYFTQCSGPCPCLFLVEIFNNVLILTPPKIRVIIQVNCLIIKI